MAKSQAIKGKNMSILLIHINHVNFPKSGDYRRGFLQSLSQLTSIGEISEVQFLSKC